jgi:lysozyme
MSSLDKLRTLLVKHEGLELKPYQDTVGKWTIGVGRNLTDTGITRDEAMFLLERDLTRCFNEARKIEWWKGLDPVRQDVIVMMIFNMGMPRFSGFKKFAALMSERKFKAAADEMLRSKWYDQVGRRATELALMIHEGKYEELP